MKTGLLKNFRGAWGLAVAGSGLALVVAQAETFSVAGIQRSGNDILITVEQLVPLENYTLERNDQLNDSTWTPISTVIPFFSGPIEFTDVGGADTPRRFYRVAIYAPPIIPVIALQTNQITADTDGTKFAYTAAVEARSGMSYHWVLSGPLAFKAGTTSSGSTANGLNTITFYADNALVAQDTNGTPFSVACSEINGAGFSGTGSAVPGKAYPRPVAQLFEVVKQGIPIANLSDGSGSATYAYTAIIVPRPGMHYLWTVPGTNTLLFVGAQGETCIFTLGTNGSAEGNPVTIQLQELNSIGDSDTRSQGYTVYSGPRSVLIGTDRPGDDPGLGFAATSGRAYTATPSLPPRGGAFTYQWQGNNVSFSGPTTDGASVSFTAGSSAPDGIPSPATISLTEVNGAGDSVTSTREGEVFPAPAVPLFTVTKPGSPTQITKVSDSSGDVPYTYTATVTPRPGMQYLWTVPGTNTLVFVGAQAETCIFTLGTNGSAEGNPITIQVQELNAISDAATGSQGCTVYSGPRSVVIGTDRPGDDPGTAFVATSGRSYTATPSLPPRGGAFTYQWQGNNVSFSGPTTDGASLSFNGGNNAPDGGPAAAAISLTEVNGAGDSATGMRGGLVFPAPAAPTIAVTRKGQATAITSVSDTALFQYTASVSPRPGMYYAWTTPGTNPESPSGSPGSPQDAFDFHFSDGTGTPAGANIEFLVREVNSIGDFQEAVQNYTVYSAPISYLISIDAPGDDPTQPFELSLGQSYMASADVRGGANSYLWSCGDMIITTTSATGSSINFSAVTDQDTPPLNPVIQLTETNGAGDSATSMRTGSVIVPP